MTSSGFGAFPVKRTLEQIERDHQQRMLQSDIASIESSYKVAAETIREAAKRIGEGVSRAKARDLGPEVIEPLSMCSSTLFECAQAMEQRAWQKEADVARRLELARGVHHCYSRTCEDMAITLDGLGENAPDVKLRVMARDSAAKLRAAQHFIDAVK